MIYIDLYFGYIAIMPVLFFDFDANVFRSNLNHSNIYARFQQFVDSDISEIIVEIIF